MATGRGGRPRTSRFDVTAKPLAGGGVSGGGELFIDPRYADTLPFRDEVRKARKAGTTISVSDDLHQTLSALDVSAESKPKNRAAYQQFEGNLKRAVLEDEKAPDENLLDPYRQAFTQLATTDPEKAALILFRSKLDLPVVRSLGNKGFKSLLATDPRRVMQVFKETGLDQRPDFVDALVGAGGGTPKKPVAAAPAAQSLPVGAGPGYQTIPTVDVDPVIPAEPARSPVPIQRGDDTKIVMKPGPNWTKADIARGYRATTVAPFGKPAVPAPKVSSVNTEGINFASTHIERERAALQFAAFGASLESPAKAKPFTDILDNPDALMARARQRVEAEFDATIAQRRAAVEAATDPAAVAVAQRKLYLTERQRAEHMASFDAMSQPRTAGAGTPAQGPGGAPRRIVEVLADRWRSDLKPTPAVGERPNPSVGEERAVVRPIPAPASPLVGLRGDVQSNAVPAHKLLAGLGVEERVALERAQDLAAALKTGRQISLGQEVAPNQVEGMQRVPLAEDTEWFDNTEQARRLNQGIKDITRRYPALAGLIDTGPALAPSPRGPVSANDRGDYAVSLSQLLGSWDAAKPFFFEDRPPNVAASTLPLFRQADNVAVLEKITGQPFYPALPAESSTVGMLNRGLTQDDLPANYSQMTPKQQAAARKKLQEKIEGSTGDRKVYGVGDDAAVKLALQTIDQGIPLGQGQRRLDIDKVEEDYPEVAAVIRKIMADSDEKLGGPVILRNQTTIDTKAYQRASINAGQRGKLSRLQEQLVAIIDGKSKFMPTVLRSKAVKATDGLVEESAATKTKKTKPKEAEYDPWASVPARSRNKRKREAMEMVNRAIEQGGIYPLDENASYWRGNFMFLDPDDGNVYYGRLTPGVLARTIAQQLLQDTGKNLRGLTAMIRRSIEVYERLPPTKAAAQFLVEKDGKLVPRTMSPSKTYMDALVNSFTSKGLDFSPIVRLDPLQEPPAQPQGKRKFVTLSPLTGLMK